MTEEIFTEQMQRLGEVFGAKHYTTPRMRVIFRSLRHFEQGAFERAVTRLIASKRSSPLVPEISEAYEAVLAEDKQRALEVAPEIPGSFLGQLEHAAKKTNADPEYVQLCMKTLREFLEKKTSLAHFREATDILDDYARQLNPTGVARNLKKVNHRWIIAEGLPSGK